MCARCAREWVASARVRPKWVAAGWGCRVQGTETSRRTRSKASDASVGERRGAGGFETRPCKKIEASRGQPHDANIKTRFGLTQTRDASTRLSFGGAVPPLADAGWWAGLGWFKSEAVAAT